MNYGCAWAKSLLRLGFNSPIRAWKLKCVLNVHWLVGFYLCLSFKYSTLPSFFNFFDTFITNSHNLHVFESSNVCTKIMPNSQTRLFFILFE